MKKTLTFYEYTTVCHKYTVDVEIPDDALSVQEWLLDEDEAVGLAELYWDVIPKQVGNGRVEQVEVWDSDGQLLLQY